MNRSKDWLHQAAADLAQAQLSAEAGHHECACFACHQAVEKALKAIHLQQVGVFGSYGRGDAGFGSDLDLLIVDRNASGGQIERLQCLPLEQLPLSCDALVLTPAELKTRLTDGSRMASELQRDLRWLL